MYRVNYVLILVTLIQVDANVRFGVRLPYREENLENKYFKCNSNGTNCIQTKLRYIRCLNHLFQIAFRYYAPQYLPESNRVSRATQNSPVCHITCHCPDEAPVLTEGAVQRDDEVALLEDGLPNRAGFGAVGGMAFLGLILGIGK